MQKTGITEDTVLARNNQWRPHSATLRARDERDRHLTAPHADPDPKKIDVAIQHHADINTNLSLADHPDDLVLHTLTFYGLNSSTRL